MSIFKIAAGVFLGLAFSAAVGIGGTVYLAQRAKTEAADNMACLIMEGYADTLVNARFSGKDKPAAPTRLDEPGRLKVERSVEQAFTTQEPSANKDSILVLMHLEIAAKKDLCQA